MPKSPNCTRNNPSGLGSRRPITDEVWRVRVRESVDPEDERGIADAIERLLDDRLLAERMQRAGRERATRFTWSATARGTLACYERAFDPPP